MPAYFHLWRLSARKSQQEASEMSMSMSMSMSMRWWAKWDGKKRSWIQLRKMIGLHTNGLHEAKIVAQVKKIKSTTRERAIVLLNGWPFARNISSNFLHHFSIRRSKRKQKKQAHKEKTIKRVRMKTGGHGKDRVRCFWFTDSRNLWMFSSGFCYRS